MDKIEHYIDKFGTEVWMLNDMYYRDDGPAIIFSDGTRYWFRDGYRHREDGPAVIRADGEIRWYINDRVYTFDDYCKKLKLTPETILELKLKYG